LRTVVDASAVLVWLQDEPGADAAEPMLLDGFIGAANWSEVLQKARRHGANAELVGRLLASFGLVVADVTRADAELAADLWDPREPMSLGDRLCLGLGKRMGLPVATADRAWAALSGGAEVVLIR
jgi:PIN domain nuclease of toxin-antitoxin system